MQIIFAYIFGIIILLIIAKLLLLPLKLLIKLVINALIGGIGLIIFNFVGGLFGVHIGLNFLTAIVTGILGVPGIILILLLQNLL